MDGGDRKRKAGIRTAATTALALCASLALLAAPASASLKIHESTRTEAITLQFDAVTASCPRGEAPISGGYDVPNPLTSDNLYFPTGSFIGDDGWQASSTLSAGDLGENALSSTAYCAKLGKDVVIRGESVSLDGPASTDLTAVCKRSEKVISGGWAVSAHADSFGTVLGSQRSGKRSWKIRGVITGGTGTLIVLADCVPAEEAPKLKARERTTPTNPAGVTAAPASCEKGEQVVSAGFETESAYLPFEFRRDTKRKWVSTGVDFGDQVDATTIVYCERLDKSR